MSRFRWNRLKRLRILCATGLVLFGLFIYFLSDDSKVRSLAVDGNYYYTPQQIYRIAGLNTESRILLEPSFMVEKRLEEDPLIEKAQVSVSGQSVHIQVEEKLIIGYYLKDGQNYVLCRNGESIAIDDQSYMKNLIHVPLLADLSDETMQAICSQFQQYPEYLNREILEKIAEILPWSESYDQNMLKLIMQDGNLVFTSISDLQMITNYQLVLTELVGEDVCLILDSANGAIDKIACDYFSMSSEERDEYRQSVRDQAEAARREAEKQSREQEEEHKDSDPAEQPESDPSQEQPEEHPDENAQPLPEQPAESEPSQEPTETADPQEPEQPQEAEPGSQPEEATE